MDKNMKANKLFINKYWVGLIFILMAYFFNYCAAKNSIDRSMVGVSSAQEQKLISGSAGYNFGTMNGVRLKIPKNYLMSKVVYAGEDRMGLGANENGSSVIDNFGILLRLSNLEPIKTDQDRLDWYAASRRPQPLKTWMMVSFDNHYPATYSNSESPSSRMSIWGPYTKDKASPYGLAHYESIQSADDGARHGYGHVEYFYRDSSRTTIICQTHKQVVYPFKTFNSCHHFIWIPQLNVVAEAFYTKDDLSRWSEIESGVREIARSLIDN